MQQQSASPQVSLNDENYPKPFVTGSGRVNQPLFGHLYECHLKRVGGLVYAVVIGLRNLFIDQRVSSVTLKYNWNRQ